MILALALMVSFSACNPFREWLAEEGERPVRTAEQPERTQEPIVYGPYVFDEAKEMSAAQHLKYYELDDAQKELYAQLYAGITNFELRINIDPSWKADDRAEAFKTVYELLERNNPEIFWFPRAYARGTYSDGAYSVRPKYLIDGGEFCTDKNARNEIVCPPEEEIAAAKAWIENGKTAVWAVIESLPIHDGMTSFEREVAVHDWLAENVEYVEDAPNKTNLYGALVEGRATCGGFAYSFQYIMRRMGIECLMYIGFLQENTDTKHVWNAVKLDGQWYQADVTSNATAGKKIDEPRFHKYFNRTDEIMARTHIIEDVPWNPRIACTATEYDYYKKSGAHIGSDEDFVQRVPEVIAKARAQGAPTFELEFAPGWAAPSEIDDKLDLIDREHYSDITYYFQTSGTLVFGRFD